MHQAPDQIVDRQISAYNTQDVTACVACFALDASLERDLEGIRLTGHDVLREFYTGLFRQFPLNRCTILKRMVVAPYIVDEELIEGRDIGPFRTVIIYRVENGLIAHARTLSRELVTPE